MVEDNDWLYFNIHNLVHFRLQREHISERSIRLSFGFFETEFLDHVDLTVQNDGPDIREHSFGGESYLFTTEQVYIKKYKLHLVNHEDEFLLAGKRDLLPFITPILQWLILKKKHCFVHATSVSVDGSGVLMPGWGGTGKTCGVACLLNDMRNTSFLSDDHTIISTDGRLLSFPQAFFIYPYHRSLYPHLFRSKHKVLMPSFLSSLLKHFRIIARPVIMGFPQLESFARKISPEHMQIPARQALPEATFMDSVPLEIVLFLERYSGTKAIIEELSHSQAKQRLIGNWNCEHGQSALDLLLAATGTGLVDLEAYYSSMSAVLDKALKNKKICLLRMGTLAPVDVGKTIVNAVRNVIA